MINVRLLLHYYRSSGKHLKRYRSENKVIVNIGNMKKSFCSSFLLIYAFASLNQLKAQDIPEDIPVKFNGYGWIVEFNYDVAFFPSPQPDSISTFESFCNQDTLFGIRLNGNESIDNDIINRLIPLVQIDSVIALRIIPVLAYYNLEFFNVTFASDNEDERRNQSKLMLQQFKWKGKTRNYYYRFGFVDENFKYRIL